MALDDYIGLMRGTYSPTYTFFSAFFLNLMRMMPIINQAPFFGSRVLPGPTKIMFAVSLFFIFLPQIFLNMSTELALNSNLVLLALKELLIGFILGFIISVPFLAASAAGALVDFQRGSSSLTQHDPIMQTQSSPIGLFYNYLSLMVFFAIDGPTHFIDAISTSYQIIPIDQFISRDFFANYQGPFWQNFVKLMQVFCNLFIQLASPPLVAVFVADMFLGLVNRLAPQVQISFLGMSLKSLLGVGFLFLSFTLLNKELQKQLFIWLKYTSNVIENFY